MLVACCQNYLGRLGRALDAELRPVEEDVFREQGLPVFFLASGGIAGTFRDVCRCVEGPYILLTTSGWNSLPASMEILAYLHEQGMQGEILHGEPEEVAPRLELLLRLAKARRALRRMRLGVIGETLSLAASRADGLQLQQRFGAQLEMLGVQFAAILDGGIYLSLAAHSNALARRLTKGLRALGIPLLVDSPSNQVFPLLPDGVVERLAAHAAFEIQQLSGDGRTCVRFVTGWSTTEAEVDALLALLE